ncbi:MAG: ABC transporter permease [Stagnimonas sp.]|nr:ABC transporter permease [Stagnimonas sp.]
MNIKRLGAMTWARSLEFLRDRSALGWNFAFPLLMVAGFAWIFSGPAQPIFKVAVLMPQGMTLQTASHPVAAAPGVQFYEESDEATARKKVERHRIDLAVDLTQTSARYFINPASQKGAAVEALLKGTGTLANGTAPAATRIEQAGEGIRYVDWAAPGVLGMNLMFSCLFGIGYVIVRYRKSGYLKRLNATPLTAAEFIVAQLLSRLVLTFTVTTVVFVGCNLFLHFRMEGSYWLLALVTAVGSYSMIAMGLVISARVTSEELAGGLLNLLSWPMMVLSGVFFSLDGAPKAVLWASQLFPLTHLLNAARAIMLDGAGLASSAVATPLAVLVACSVVFTVLGAIGFRWTQD